MFESIIADDGTITLSREVLEHLGVADQEAILSVTEQPDGSIVLRKVSDEPSQSD